MEEDLKKDLEQMAQEEGRSLNNLINHLLKCAVVSKGILRRASGNNLVKDMNDYRKSIGMTTKEYVDALYGKKAKEKDDGRK